MAGLTLQAEECAEELLGLYESQPLHSVRAEAVGSWEDAGGSLDGRLSVYVKSLLEPSIDEVPILRAILEALESMEVRAGIYEYDSIGGESGYASLRLVQVSLARGEPFLLLLPAQRSVVLASQVPGDYWEAIEESLAITVEVRAGTPLYLPEQGPARLVAKRNSQQSYERVVWLTQRARELGVELLEPRYLQSNREIFEYVVSVGREGPLRRVPVNKLASYIIALRRCGILGGLRSLSKIDSSIHYIYAYRVPGRLLEAILEGLRSPSLRLAGTLYNLAHKGATRVFEEILSRLTA